ncbi:MAG: hypothetical protein GEU74_02350 [Nitriliruptorales bacterium]|nr:hypothetical protein [Nitriliruptorales bacterium]
MHKPACHHSPEWPPGMWDVQTVMTGGAAAMVDFDEIHRSRPSPRSCRGVARYAAPPTAKGTAHANRFVRRPQSRRCVSDARRDSGGRWVRRSAPGGVMTFALDDEDVRAVLAAALSAGAEFAEVYAEQRRSRTVRLDDRRIESLTSGRDRGAGIRVQRGAQTAYAYTNVLSRHALLDAARVAAAGVQGSSETSVADLTHQVPQVMHPAAKDPFAVDGTGLVAIVREAEDAAWSVSAELRQVTVIWADTGQDVYLANSEGVRLTEGGSAPAWWSRLSRHAATPSRPATTVPARPWAWSCSTASRPPTSVARRRSRRYTCWTPDPRPPASCRWSSRPGAAACCFTKPVATVWKPTSWRSRPVCTGDARVSESGHRC